MPTTPNAVSGLVAISADSKIKPLGYITWFSVPDEAVSLRRLRTMLASHGLPPSLAPKDTKAIDVFRRAMRAQEGKRRENGHMTETAVAQVVETSEDLVYQLSQVVRDPAERVVIYERSLRVIFSKRTEEPAFNVLDRDRRAELRPVIEGIEEFMDRNSTRVTGARVRGVVRNYLKSQPDEQRNIEGLSGENMRGKAGGIYFVLAKHADQIVALSEMLDELYQPRGRAYLHAVPMADGASEREIVRRHHKMNALAEMSEMEGDVRGLLSEDRERAPRSDVVSNQWKRYRALERRLAEYQGVLQEESEDIDQHMKVLHGRLQRLIG